MESNQQQTDLPQETSPHHVYGNQHFSRDTLIASEGGGGGVLGEGAKTIGFSPVRRKEKSADRRLHSLTAVCFLRARCQTAFVAT